MKAGKLSSRKVPFSCSKPLCNTTAPNNILNFRTRKVVSVNDSCKSCALEKGQTSSNAITRWTSKQQFSVRMRNYFPSYRLSLSRDSSRKHFSSFFNREKMYPSSSSLPSQQRPLLMNQGNADKKVALVKFCIKLIEAHNKCPVTRFVGAMEMRG